MFFHLDFRVEYGAARSQQHLFATWACEAVVALDAKRASAPEA